MGKGFVVFCGADGRPCAVRTDLILYIVESMEGSSTVCMAGEDFQVEVKGSVEEIVQLIEKGTSVKLDVPLDVLGLDDHSRFYLKRASIVTVRQLKELIDKGLRVSQIGEVSIRRIKKRLLEYLYPKKDEDG